jgi:transposase-like protein
MATRYIDEFRRDAVRIAISSCSARPQVSSDLGVVLSTLNKWVQQHPLPGRALRSNVPRGFLAGQNPLSCM